MKKSLTRTAFALVPIELLEKLGDKKGAIVVYCWLWHYAGRDDQAFPSVERLAAECRMKPDGVRACLKSLAAEGWISRVDRPGQTTLFHVRSERVNPSPKWGTPPPNGGSPERGSTPLPQMGDPTPPPNGGPNNKHLTKTTYQEVLEPPLPPKGERRAERVDTHPYRDRDGFLVNPDQPQATEAQPQPTQPVKPWEAPQQPPQPQTPPVPQTSLAHAPVDPQSQKRKAGFTPTKGDVPAALLPVVSELLEFWPTRSGAKSKQAWNLMLTEAGKIQGHAHGGTEILREQLRQGIKAKIQKGKGWASLDFDRWLQYGTKAGTPISGTGFNRKPTTMDRIQGALEIIRRNEAAKAAAEAAEAAGQQGTLALAEVA